MARQGSSGVTVSNIAALAGVSPGTVSKALNGRGQLRPETRQRVFAAATELGFKPTLLGRGLLSGRTYTVGVITTDSIGRFTIPILTGAEDAFGAGEMSMFLCESRGDPIREQHYLRVLLGRRVDGILITGRSSDVRPSLGVDFPVPVVYALVQSDNPQDTSVLHDDRQGARDAVSHLLATGRARIAHISGPPHHTATQNRVAGALDALIPSGSNLVGGPLLGEWSEKWGREATHQLLRSHESFDGVFCGNDQIARGVLDTLRENGIDVPTQVGVVGVDNWDAMSANARPPLTTIDLNLNEIGNRAARLLLGMIESRSSRTGLQMVATRIVKRRSTEVD